MADTILRSKRSCVYKSVTARRDGSNTERTKVMKLPSHSKLATFASGVMAASLAGSISLNIAFYRGTLTSPTGSYCAGFYDGSTNAIAGSTPTKSPVSAPVDLKKKAK